MWKWFRWILLSIGVLFAILILFFMQPWVFLPHERIQMSLPFAESEDATVGLIPLGEKIEHNESNGTPDGHPGLDFGFGHEANILAVADGRIMAITKDKGGKYNIEEQMGYYKTVYKELNDIDPNLHFFSKIKRGQVLGKTGHAFKENEKKTEEGPSGQMHWDFGSASMKIDRLCPVNYFDAESKARIQKIWARIPANDIFKKQYPEICNGIFKGKEE